MEPARKVTFCGALSVPPFFAERVPRNPASIEAFSTVMWTSDMDTDPTLNPSKDKEFKARLAHLSVNSPVFRLISIRTWLSEASRSSDIPSNAATSCSSSRSVSNPQIPSLASKLLDSTTSQISFALSRTPFAQSPTPVVTLSY